MGQRPHSPLLDLNTGTGAGNVAAALRKKESAPPVAAPIPKGGYESLAGTLTPIVRKEAGPPQKILVDLASVLDPVERQSLEGERHNPETNYVIYDSSKGEQPPAGVTAAGAVPTPQEIIASATTAQPVRAAPVTPVRHDPTGLSQPAPFASQVKNPTGAATAAVAAKPVDGPVAKGVGDNLANAHRLPIALPSNYAVYEDINLITIRRLSGAEAVRITTASQMRNISLQVATIGATLDVPIGQLWVADWRAVMFWHRIYSYKRVPYIAHWRSRRGNDNSTPLDFNTIDMRPMKISRNEWNERFRSKRLRVPDMDDYCWFANTNLDIEDRSWFNRAQYFDFDPSIDRSTAEGAHAAQLDRIAKIKTDGIDIDLLQDVYDLVQLLAQHGPNWVFKARDAKYNAHEQCDELRQAIAELTPTKDEDPIDPDLVAAMRLELGALEREIEAAQGQPVLAPEEEVEVRFDPFTFFPAL